jgi:protein subunit release factor A
LTDVERIMDMATGGGGVESSISSFKSMFGEYAKSKKWKYMVNEMFAKARLYV